MNVSDFSFNFVEFRALRTLLHIAAVQNLCMWVADITTAFLHAPTDDVFVRPPTTHRSPGRIWRLHRALYGLRKAPHHFQEWLVSVLVEKLGFECSRVDPSIFVNMKMREYMCVHVDDPLAVGTEEAIAEMWTQLEKHVLIIIKRAGKV